MELFPSIRREPGGNPTYRAGMEAYLKAVETLLVHPTQPWRAVTSDDLEVALSVVEPPAQLSSFQVGKLLAAMRAVMRERDQRAERNWQALADAGDLPTYNGEGAW